MVSIITMNQKTLRIVLTGSPSSGKTTLINHIGDMGYRCFPEISRDIIQTSIENNLDITPWQNLAAFSNMVWQKREGQFVQANPGWNFYDRSLVDIVAYEELNDSPINEQWEERMQALRYDLVFIARPWPDIFVNDEQRREDWAQSLRVDEALINAYRKRGYHPIALPEVSVEERAAFVLEHIKRHL